jgi:hypothetical protein
MFSLNAGVFIKSNLLAKKMSKNTGKFEKKATKNS